MIPANLFTLAALALAVTAAPLSKRSQFTGRGTWYGAGVSIGNCGWQSSGSESVVALNTAQYGSTSQVSQYCGQTVTITYNGITQQARIVDSCPTCSFGDLDMSKSLFSALTGNNLDLGEMEINWSFGTSNDASPAAPIIAAPPTVVAPPVVVAPPTTIAPPTVVAPLTTIAPPTVITPPTPTTTIPAPTPSVIQTSTPQWWAIIGSGSCPDVILPAGMDPVAISPSKKVDVDALSKSCGKSVQITNLAMNLTTVAMMTDYYLVEPNTTITNNTIYMADSYLKIANMSEGVLPYIIQNVTWGFLDS